MLSWILALFPASAITNIVQTAGIAIFATLVKDGVMTGNQEQAIIAGLTAVALVIYNLINHNDAVTAPPPAAKG